MSKFTALILFFGFVQILSSLDKDKKRNIGKNVENIQIGPHKKYSRSIDTKSNPAKSNSLRHKATPLAHSEKKLRGIGKRGIENKDNNEMLLLEASNGFQKAIETDINELSNPTFYEQSKKSEIWNISEHVEDIPVKINTIEKEENISSPIQNTTVYMPVRDAVGNDKNMTIDFGMSPFDLVSETALHYSEFISEEMRIVAQAQQEKQFYICQLISDPNCTYPMNATHGLKLNSNLPQETNTSDNFSHDTLNLSNNELDDVSSQKNFYMKECSQWSEWSECNDTCISGVIHRYRDCFDQNNVNVPENQSLSCSDPNCLYCTDWSKYTSCSKTCGTGIKYKQRNCYFKDGSVVVDKKEEPCNFHSCHTECGTWSDWTECSKPCDTGVTIRMKNCTLADSSIKTFYEHHACNTQPCNTTNITSLPINDGLFIEKNATSDHGDVEEKEGCLSAHISFEKFQYNVNTVFDDTDEHNDVEYKNVVLFDGNHSCGYSGVFTGRESSMKFYDDIFRNFDNKEFSALFWLYPISISENKTQNKTLFSFYSKFFDYGKYTLLLDDKNNLIFSVRSNSSEIIGASLVSIQFNSWYHIAATYSEAKDVLEIFVNGEKSKLMVYRKTWGIQMNIQETSQYPIDHQFQGFGNDENNLTPLSAVIDEIYVLKCSMDKSEVLTVANICPARRTKTCPSPMNGLCAPSMPYFESKEIDTFTPSQTFQTPLNTI